jgi:hypothetical protein
LRSQSKRIDRIYIGTELQGNTKFYGTHQEKYCYHRSEPAHNIATVSAQNNLSEFDLFSEELAAGWERIIGPLIALILALATSVEEFEISKKA